MCYKADIKNRWEISIARNLDQIEAMRETWTKLHDAQLSPDVNVDIDRYISILQSEDGQVKPFVILVSQSNQESTIAVGRIQNYPLTCRIGYKEIMSPLLRCLIIDGSGILGQPDNVVANTLLDEFLSVLRRAEADVILFNRIKTDSLLYQLARKKPSCLCREHFPRIEPHLRMFIPENLDLFYQSCSAKSRRNLRRSVKRLKREFPDEVKLVTYCRENEIEDALNAASQISRRTYQYALGAGLTDNAQTRFRMATAAKHGWFRLSVLYVGTKPCAFLSGLQYRKTYFLEHMGFDPEWGKWDVGTALFGLVLEELCSDPSVQFIDFGSGDAFYKRVYANIAWEEARLFVFAPRLYPISINMLLSFTKGSSLFLELALKKAKLDTKIKRRWRDRLQQETTNNEESEVES